jgi:3-oxoacyl-[acyl-carrier protein] reductase
MLEGKSIVVTGAGRGIGRAIAAACVRAGALVGVNYHASKETARELCSTHPDRFILLAFDVRDPVAIAKCIAEFCERAGRIDGWVNNAGVNRPGLLIATDINRIREQIEVNLLGPILCAQAVLPVMLQQGSGVILNVTSVAAVRPVRGQAVYAATKGGLESLTRALAVEYARKGIRVHGIRPGPIGTQMMETTALAEDQVLAHVPLRRLGRPEEVAELAVFLMSDRASYSAATSWCRCRKQETWRS